MSNPNPNPETSQSRRWHLTHAIPWDSGVIIAFVFMLSMGHILNVKACGTVASTCVLIIGFAGYVARGRRNDNRCVLLDSCATLFSEPLLSDGSGSL